MLDIAVGNILRFSKAHGKAAVVDELRRAPRLNDRRIDERNAISERVGKMQIQNRIVRACKKHRFHIARKLRADGCDGFMGLFGAGTAGLNERNERGS